MKNNIINLPGFEMLSHIEVLAKLRQLWLNKDFSLCLIPNTPNTTKWQALGKSCGWDKEYAEKYNIKTDRYFIGNAMEFHHINLTEGWGAAVNYLTGIINKE